VPEDEFYFGANAHQNPLWRILERQRKEEEFYKQWIWGDVNFKRYPFTLDWLERHLAGQPDETRTKPVFHLRPNLAQTVRELWGRLPLGTRMGLEAGILLPAGALSFIAGLAFPDLDIVLLGIGTHRFFLFHSALAVIILKKFLEDYQTFLAENPSRVCYDKLLAISAAGAGYGIALHLAVDGLLQGNQDVTFGLPGVFQFSLVEGTLVDDNIWLVGNALYAFKLSNQILVLAFGEELAALKEYVQKNFGPLKRG